MAKLLRGHSRPIAQNLIAAAIYEFLRSGVPALVTWWAAYKASLTPGWSTPWIILLGAIVFLAISAAMRVLLDSRARPNTSTDTPDQSCPDKPLHAIADHDQNHINDAVSVESCRPEYFLTPPSPYIDFIFTVFNGSVYRVSVRTPIEGNIIILNHRLSGRIQLMQHEVGNLERCTKATLCIRQWLNSEEADLISQASDREQFLFLGLHVPIDGGDHYPNVLRRNLKLVRGVQKDGRALPDR